MNFILEICADSIESAINAQIAGAHRVELCGNLTEGGTTPGFGTITSARNNLDIDLNVMIRPRGGDFLYSDPEYDIMRRDIEICGEAGVNGIVIGILGSSGAIDFERTAKLAELAAPMTVTFHRAFDMCSDPVQGLEDVIATGADRLLTSGQRNKAGDGLELIRQLMIQAGERIVIMPGSGIDESNIAIIAAVTKAQEYHLTASKSIDSQMIFRRHGITMGAAKDFSEFTRKVADIQRIKSIISILQDI